MNDVFASDDTPSSYSPVISDGNKLIQAAIEGNADKVKDLLDHDADVNEVNKFGQTALIGAVLNNQREVIQLICGYYADMVQVEKFRDQLKQIINFDDEEQSIPFAKHKLNNVAHVFKMKEALERLAIKNSLSAKSAG